MTCKVCAIDATNAFFHQALHKENRSNKIVQAAIGVIILTGTIFAILGATPYLPMKAMAWGIGGATVSIIALGIFRYYSSTETERNWEELERETQIRIHEMVQSRQVTVDRIVARTARETEWLGQRQVLLDQGRILEASRMVFDG